MTFIIYWLNGINELMPLERLFEQRTVEKTLASAAKRAIDPIGHGHDDASRHLALKLRT